MNEEELKYVLQLLDNGSEKVFEEILQFYEDVDESKSPKELSEEAFDFFTKNLKNNPVTTNTVLSFIQQYCSENNAKRIQALCLQVCRNEVTEAQSIERLITLMSLIKWNQNFKPEFVNHVLKYISEDAFRQYRKQILLSLIPLDVPQILNDAADSIHKHEPQKEFKLTPEYMLELCYQDKTHWLLKAAQVYKNQLHDLKNVTFKINNFTKQILIMVLIDLTNGPETYDLPSLVHQLTNIFSILDTYTTTDDQLQFYITEVKRELTIIKFCLENNCKIMSTSVFTQVLTQSALAVISQVCRLSKVDRYKVSRLLNTNNDFINELLVLSNKKNLTAQDESNVNWDFSTYNSYCAITKIIDTIVNSSEGSENVEHTTTSVDEIRRLILAIQPLQFCIEVIENIFACLFLRFEYFSCYAEHNQDYSCGAHSECSYFYSKKQAKNTSINSGAAGFMCNAYTTQIILNTLKLCLENLEDNNNIDEIEQSLNVRFKQLVKVVNHSVWKLQLVSTLSPDTSPLRLKLCLDYVDVDESSDEESRLVELKPQRKRPKVRRKHSSKHDVEQVMLASTISTDESYMSSTGNAIDFVSIMLAKPTCLVALALYNNDFPKANQILEMFDLADSEIATEVTFTEQLRNLVAKIKNIIYYRDDTRYPTKELSALSVVSTEVMGLVEGFLASNRAPNSFDIMELGARHPHLQLYSHQNVPFINSVDILISSGLNKEITYGLINVVERKLAEVRNCTDISAVKKTNYIRFVEDIVSVMFELFGYTEKSFDFIDNICGLLSDCRVPIKYKEFCKLNQISKELKQSCEDLAGIVSPNESSPVDFNLLQKYHQIYMNVVAASDKDLCNIAEVSRQSNKKTRTPYLRMCYMYCKTVSHLEQEDDKKQDSGSMDMPYFFVLEKQLHDIFGRMINSKDIPVTYLEPICKKLNVNLIPKLILNFCPSITLSGQHKEASEIIFNNLLQVVYDFKNPEENLFLDPVANFAPLPRRPDTQCLTYIVLNNWVLAHIIKKVHTSPDENCLQQSMDVRTRCLNNYMELDRFNYTKDLFGTNKYLASLHTTIDLDKLFAFMPELLDSGKILKCLNLIDNLSERQLMCSSNLTNLRDLILFKLATNPKITDNWNYCQYLRCSELKVDLVLNNINCWPADGALEALDYLRFLLNQESLEESLYDRCTEWMIKIPLYDQIAPIMGVHHWYDIYEQSCETPECVIDALMDSQQFKLCLEWADVHNVSDNMKNLIVMNLLRQLFEYTNQATPLLVKELLSRLSASQAIDLIQEEMSKVRHVEILQVCVEFISERSFDWKAFENIKIGLQIMLEIDKNWRHMFWDLIDRPLLMIEQFLMNAKLDILANILNKIAPSLKKDPSGDNLYYNIKLIEGTVISRNAVDALLRFYGEKALDLKNPRNNCPVLPKPSDDSLLQSIDSINIEAATRPFVMPEQVPTRDQWTEDYSTDRCMLCRTSMFSMIIRRHHCRRCGRLVCHACSRHRMQVPTYPGGVKFRVCDDCYVQTMNKRSGTDNDNLMMSSNSDSAGSGVTCMDWCLSVNSKKNEAVRTEFSYEFTPNVTLCLSIMKMHTINLDYPRFLLDRSDEVARELSNGGDSRLLVRARRSLLLAAAEIYSRTPNEIGGGGRSVVAETGAAHAARCLAHADAMATLVKHQAHHLIPHQGAHPSQIVRSLLEAEKWELALEIATKSGIPRNSVLAAWGKACLKAGCFKQAREKFAHCFKNTMNIPSDLPDDCEYGREASEPQYVNRRLQNRRYTERTSSVSSAQSDGRPRTNPPLLNEIISMLEDMNYPVNQQLLNKAETIKATNEKLTTMNTSKKKIQLTEPALNIMHTLASVKKIKQGDYSDFQTAVAQPKKSLAQGLLRRNNHSTEPKIDYTLKRLDPFFYKECLFYLANYGSQVANIAFYMKHSDLTEVLRYCYDNMVDKETFTDSVYMECLKKDKVNDLLKTMTDLDSSLNMWSDYIMHICRTLEVSKRLEALYAVQCGSGQHARASASCALLYARPVRTRQAFAALLARQHHLTAALHHLSQCVPLSNKPTDSKSIHFNLDKATIDNLMTTITRQMELAKYLAAAEASERLTEKVLNEVIPVQTAQESRGADFRPLTLFGSTTDKIRLVAAVLATGPNIENGFELAFKIITEHKLDSMNIYTHVARYLVQVDRFIEVKTLAKCIRASKETAASLMSDQVLESGVSAVVKKCESRGQLHDEQAEILIADIHSVTIKISCYLVCRNVSNAYILAARNDRTNDLRRVLDEAERLRNDQVRNACLKRLTSKNVL